MRTLAPDLQQVNGSPGVPRSGAPGFPCLYSNNCNDVTIEDLENRCKAIAFNTRRSASALAWNVQFMAEKHGIENLGFLTLTFRQHVIDPKEAQRRFHSLATGVLRKRYSGYIRVFERQRSERIHYHLLVILPEDIRTGFDWAAITSGNYRSASSGLRSEWAFWRRTAPAYGFGRTELLPIRSTSEGIARYVGKYLGKHHMERLDCDKGVRLVDYSGPVRCATTRFAWVSDGAAAWRRKVALFAAIVAEHTGQVVTFENLAEVVGSRWAYYNKDFICSLPDTGPVRPPGVRA